MNRRALSLLMGFAALLLVVTSGRVSGSQLPTYRAMTRSVEVSVSVRQRNRPVQGLTEKDFVLTDNGVIQKITVIGVEDFPLDVTLVIDLSGSARDALVRTRDEVRRMVGLLGTADRVRILAIGSSPRIIVPWMPVRSVQIPELRGGGLSAVYDTIAAAFLGASEPGRRRLIVMLSDGIDTASAMDLEHLEELARRSDSVLFTSFSEPGRPSHQGVTYYHRIPISSPERALERLRRLATATGGESDESLWPGGADASAIFGRAVDAFRRSYVLRYSPENVASAGWHELNVQLVNPKSYSVRFRRGYFQDP